MACDCKRCSDVEHKYDIYWAAGLFTDSERRYNAECVARLESAGKKVFLPQRDAGELGRDGDKYAIRMKDVEGIRSSRCIVATLEGRAYDEGTVYEIGYGEALGMPVHILHSDVRSIPKNAMLCTCAWYTNIDELFARWEL